MLEFKYGDVCSSQNKIVTYNNCAACKRRISLLIFDEDENTLKVKCAQEKPPLELKPRFIVEQARIGEIRMAMNRYIDEFKTIPLEWIFEYNDLAHRQRMTNGKCK